jgi:glycosyltransferase involved in cell wall biosynthesis
MLASEIEAEFPEMAGRVSIMPNAVEVSAVAVIGPADRRPEELLFVGQRRASKGIATLLEAVAIVRRRRPSVTVRLIGGAAPEDDATWRRQAAALGIADGVSFEPAAGRPGHRGDGRATLFVHPSRATFSVGREAPRPACPWSRRTRRGHRDLGERPDAHGAIVPLGNPERLAAAIEATIDRRATIDLFDSAGRSRRHAW